MKQIIIIFTFVVSWIDTFAQNYPIKLKNLNLREIVPNVYGNPPQPISQLIIDKAKAGNAESQYLYGIYLRRMNLAKTFLFLNTEDEGQEAIKWFERAAAQGHKEASIEAGIIYFQRFSINFSNRLYHRKALNYLKQGGAENDAILMLLLAQLALWRTDDTGHLKSCGTDAVRLCNRAIAKGLPLESNLPLHRKTNYPNTLSDAYMILAATYRNATIDTPQDLQKYFTNIRLSADCGNKLARLYLGECYYAGIGVSEDRAKATEIWNALIAEDSYYSEDVNRIKNKYSNQSNDKKQYTSNSPEDILRSLLAD